MPVILAILLCCLPLYALAAEPDEGQWIDVPNAEDLAALPGGRWVVASSMPGGDLQHGALYLVDTRSDRARIAYAGGGASTHSAWPSCGGPVSHDQFSPHGIAVQTLAAGGATLFVVNHGRRESVEVFKVSASEMPMLLWQGCIPLPMGAVGNAVAVTPQGQIFLTNTGNLLSGVEKGERRMGEVLEWSRTSGWRSVTAEPVYSPNGLLVSDDGNTLFVNSWAAGQVLKLARTPQGVQRELLSLPFLPDNLRWAPGGVILVTGMSGPVEAVAQCFAGKGPCDTIPTGIARLQVEPWKLQCRRELRLPLGTVSIAVGDDLWVGPVRGEGIRLLPRGWSDWAGCG